MIQQNSRPGGFTILLLGILILVTANKVSATETACPFIDSTLSFAGSPVEQARCLLRPVKRYAKLGKPLAHLPAPLENLIGQPVSFGKTLFRKYLKTHRINEADLGGLIDQPLSRANNNDPAAPFARYFLIHDTSTPNYLDQPIPANINQPEWKHNRLIRWAEGSKSKAHVFINRLGESITTVDFAIPWRTTKFEIKILKERGRGLCLGVELVQPRHSDPEGPTGNDAIAPNPGFTTAQLQRLALVYIAASLRRGDWMIPAFHAAMDAGIPEAHDDPQNFDLNKWAGLLDSILKEIQASDAK